MRFVSLLLSLLVLGWVLVQMLGNRPEPAVQPAAYQQSLQAAEAASQQLQQSAEQRAQTLVGAGAE